MSKSEFAKLGNYVFGGTSAITTNICLIVGLGSSQAGKMAVLGSLLTIALADNISDSLGIHMYKESEGLAMKLSLWATVINFFARFFVSLSFIAIVLALGLPQAGLVAVVWGLFLLIVFSFIICRANGIKPLYEIFKHVLVAMGLIAASFWAGRLIALYF